MRAFDRRALEATGRVMAGVTDESLDGPTPCAGWSLRALIVHMAGNNNGFADAAEGKPADPDVWEGTGISGDPVGEYHKSAERVRAAFGGNGVLDRTFDVYPFGQFPGQTAVAMHFVDYLVHGWDVARAIGADDPLDPELCLVVLRMAQRWPETSWGPGAPFAYPVPVPEDAPAQDRLVGFLGRSPSWPQA
ncbi:MAG: TIGR03086 family metal-binding protein [Labedaea sp.]